MGYESQIQLGGTIHQNWDETGMPEGYKTDLNACPDDSRAVVDWQKAIESHPLLDDFRRSKQPDLERIDIPTYVVASWTDHGIHTRGTIEGFRRIASRHKYLEVHGRKKWSRYYWDESVQRQISFFDRYLKGQKNEVDHSGSKCLCRCSTQAPPNRDDGRCGQRGADAGMAQRRGYAVLHRRHFHGGNIEDHGVFGSIQIAQ